MISVDLIVKSDSQISVGLLKVFEISNLYLKNKLKGAHNHAEQTVACIRKHHVIEQEVSGIVATVLWKHLSSPLSISASDSTITLTKSAKTDMNLRSIS